MITRNSSFAIMTKGAPIRLHISLHVNQVAIYSRYPREQSHIKYNHETHNVFISATNGHSYHAPQWNHSVDDVDTRATARQILASHIVSTLSFPSFLSHGHHGRIAEPSPLLRGVCHHHSPACSDLAAHGGDLMSEELPLRTAPSPGPKSSTKTLTDFASISSIWQHVTTSPPTFPSCPTLIFPRPPTTRTRPSS